MTQAEFDDLAKEYNRQTGFQSFAHMHRRTPAYAKLIAAGREVIPFIINGFRNYDKKTVLGLDQDVYGMAWACVLMDITHESPIEPEPVAGGGFVAWDVDETCKAWIKWFYEQPQSTDALS